MGNRETNTVQLQAPPLGGELILQTPNLQMKETRWGEVTRDDVGAGCVPGAVGIIWASQPSLTTTLWDGRDSSFISQMSTLRPREVGYAAWGPTAGLSLGPLLPC